MAIAKSAKAAEASKPTAPHAEARVVRGPQTLADIAREAIEYIRTARRWGCAHERVEFITEDMLAALESAECALEEIVGKLPADPPKGGGA